LDLRPAEADHRILRAVERLDAGIEDPQRLFAGEKGGDRALRPPGGAPVVAVDMEQDGEQQRPAARRPRRG
jgi:hypothetical protein